MSLVVKDFKPVQVMKGFVRLIEKEKDSFLEQVESWPQRESGSKKGEAQWHIGRLSLLLKQLEGSLSDTCLSPASSGLKASD